MLFVCVKTALVGTAVSTNNILPVKTFPKIFSRTPILRNVAEYGHEIAVPRVSAITGVAWTPFSSSLCRFLKTSPSAKSSFENQFIQFLFSCERFCTWTRLETEAEGNSEMAHFHTMNLRGRRMRNCTCHAGTDTSSPVQLVQ